MCFCSFVLRRLCCFHPLQHCGSISVHIGQGCPRQEDACVLRCSCPVKQLALALGHGVGLEPRSCEWSLCLAIMFPTSSVLPLPHSAASCPWSPTTSVCPLLVRPNQCAGCDLRALKHCEESRKGVVEIGCSSPWAGTVLSATQIRLLFPSTDHDCGALCSLDLQKTG